MSDDPLRAHLLEVLEGRGAHLDFDAALAGVPYEAVGVRPEGVPHSLWELVEHLRIALWDLVGFSRDPRHESPGWPDGYWPPAQGPESPAAWQASLDAYRRHLEEMKELVRDEDRDPFQTLPWGDGQTLAREALLAADHAAYHLGQIVDVRRLLGLWPPGEAGEKGESS